MDLRSQLNNFFIDSQPRALRQIELATGSREEAKDILQEAMISLAKSYSEQYENWPKIFQRIIQNLINDWYRRKKVRSILFWWQQHESGEDADAEAAVDENLEEGAKKNVHHHNPEILLTGSQTNDAVREALEHLPLRQQQVFVLRAWWEYDTKDTAYAMGCSEGSVKTHYFRALASLRELLKEYEL